MSERKRKRGRPRVAPVLSYGTELRLRNSIDRNIKKPKYLRDREDIEGSRESTPARSNDTDDKSSISGRTKAFRGYNLEFDHDRDSEYHYGSDFDGNDESDQDRKTGISSSLDTSSTDDSDMEIGCEYDQGDGAIGGAGDIVPFWKLGPAGSLGHRTHTPVPVWLQDKTYPSLNIPRTSEDLLLPNFILFKAIGIYEMLRHFQNLLRLSPFRFEDFCASLLSEDQNTLLVEIHITLLKALIREEESQQTHFGPLDLKDSINILLYLIDTMTWAEILRLYLHSDKEFASYLEIMNSCQYPFTNLENRLNILQFLCDQFLQTSPVRDNLQNEGKVRYDDHCRVCHKTGDLLCCDSCSAVYHLDCIDPPLTQSPAELEDWTCSICKIHQVDGVTDCLSPMEASGLLCRQEPLGYDRHGRKYWFLIRRIIVEAEDGELWYYSSVEQFDLLQSIIDGTELEEGLHIAFREFGEDIRKQMKITEKLTDKARGSRKSILKVDLEKSFVKEEAMKSEIKNEDSMDQDQKENKDTGLITINEQTHESYLNKNKLKKEKKEVLTDDEKHHLLHEKKSIMATTGGKRPPKNDDQLYCLGCDNAYKNYSNLYTTNTLALNKLQHNEERDKKRYLSHKFSLGSPVEFKWNGQTHGSVDTMISTVRQTLLNLESNISTYFYHPHWSQIRKMWQQAAVASSNSCHFAKLFRWLTVCVKSCVFQTVWNESLGHIQLKRITALEREEKKKQEKRDKKEADEESRYYPFVKYRPGIRHQLWKMKGEEYRIHGLWGWAWVASQRKVVHQSMDTIGLRAGPEKITIPIKSSPTAGSGVPVTTRGLPISPSAFKQLSAKSPSLKISILSPNQLKAEQNGLSVPQEEKKNEIIITNLGVQQKVEVTPINLEEYFVDGIINISKNLSSKNRLVYPKLGKPSSLDSLLSRRVALQLKEEKEISSKKLFSVNKKVETNPEEQPSTEGKLTETAESQRTDNVEELVDSQRLIVHKDRPAGHLLKEMRTYKLRYEALDKLDDGVGCYSNICRKNGRNECYSPSCLLREKVKQKLLNSINIYKIVTSKPAPFGQVGTNFPITFEDTAKSDKTGETKQPQPEQQALDIDESSQSSSSSCSGAKLDRVYSSEDTRNKVFLKKLTSPRKKIKSLRLPQITNFKRKSRSNNTDGGYSVMVLAPWELKTLARRAGRINVSGFNHGAKANNAAWPYPCSRPAFKTMWLYRTSTIKSISAAALQLRILWTNFKWDDMSEKGPIDGRKQVTTDTEIIQTEILKRKYFGKFLEKTEYLQRKVIIPLDVPRPVREFTPSQRSGLRKRRRAQSPVSKQPQSLEIWIDEDKLTLWEVRHFGERLEKSSLLSKKPVQYDKTNDAITSSITASPLEFKANLEEQLKVQRANFNQKKSLEGSLSGGIVKLSVGGAMTNAISKITLSGKTIPANSTVVNLPSMVSGKKIVTTRGGKIITVQAPSTIATQGDKTPKLPVGNPSVFSVSSLPKLQVTPQGNKILRFQTLPAGRQQRTILPRGTSPTNIVMPTATTTTSVIKNNQSSPTSAVAPIRSGGQQICIYRLANGQLQVRGLQDGQSVVQTDGRLQLVNSKTNAGAGTSTVCIPQMSNKLGTAAEAVSPNKTGSPLQSGQIVKINGQQMVVRANQNPKQVVTLGNKNTNLAEPVSKALLLKPAVTPDSPAKAGIIGVKKIEQPSTNTVASVDTSTNSITLRVQVRMTEEGPKTIIQGLQPGIVLTKDHIMAIQQQVRTMLTQYNLQVNQLSPLMTLTLHLPKGVLQPGQQVVAKAPTSQATPLRIAKVERKDASNILLSQGGETAVSKTMSLNKLLKKDDAAPLPNQFVLTDDYIQQSIKSALKRSDLSPDVEEKLMQLQKYTTEKTDNQGLKAEDEALLKSLKRGREEEDEDWLNEQLGIKPKPKKIKPDKPVRPKREPQTSSKALVQESKKKIAKQQKLDGFLTKHKELLKKDILKKRALLEKELQLRIHKELTVARQHLDKMKSPDINTSMPRKRTSVDTTPKHQQPAFKKETANPITPMSPQKVTKSVTPKPKKVSKSKKIVCICRTPFDDTKFYVGCDLCGNWFHGDCVGITEALSRTMTEYVCDDCANAKLNKELFCICRQPYDETQFYICCEKCEDWYHGKCIGIMQVEAEDIDDYICPKCEPNNQWNNPCQKKLNSKDYAEVKKVAKSLVQHKSAWPFLEPVDQSEVPDYYKVVKEPMDLRTVESKVNGHKYLNLAQFVGNVMLVFDNCRAYNPPNSSFCTCAIALEAFFCGRLKQLKQRLVQKS